MDYASRPLPFRLALCICKAKSDSREERCNELLLDCVDKYLERYRTTRDDLVAATRRIIDNRRIPTGQEVADLLLLDRRHLPRTDVNVLLDLLGYAGVLRMADSRAYFPW